ncbi:hypothetical protein BGW38_004951, partial [Lunasporangiospora selenospora]
MESAFELANQLYEMETGSHEEIAYIFEEYQRARLPSGQSSVGTSSMAGKLIHSKISRIPLGFLADTLR